MRALFTGSRAWADEDAILAALNEIIAGVPDEELHTVVAVHGACPRGADAYTGYWARQLGLTVEAHPADWSRGRQAGIVRNLEMVDLGADICFAFIQDASPGATHCANAAEEAGIPTRRIEKCS